MFMNNKGVMRTFEAIIAAVIMILGIAFILSDSGTTFSPNPSWEVINARNSAEDVLVVLEKGEINGESEIGYYINNQDINSLERKLQSIIPPVYSYKFNIFELENVVFIRTFGEAINNGGNLSNGYIVGGSLTNNNTIWKYHESQEGWPGEYIIYFPNGGSITIYGMLVVDQLNEITGYDSIYLSLDNEDPVNFTNSASKLSSYTPLRAGDTVSFSTIINGAEYEYTYQISNIAKDGNSISLALVGEYIRIDLLGTNTKKVNIFDDTFRFTLLDGGTVDIVNIEKKIGEPDQFTTYLEGLKQGEWTVFGNYTGNIASISYNGANGHIILEIVPFKNNVIKIEKPGEMETTISAKRIVSVWDSSGVRAFYVSLIMGREKL